VGRCSDDESGAGVQLTTRARDRFRRFFELVAACQCGEVVRGCPFGNIAAEMGTTDPLIRESVGRVFDGHLGYLQQALKEAATTGGSPMVADVARLSWPAFRECSWWPEPIPICRNTTTSSAPSSINAPGAIAYAALKGSIRDGDHRGTRLQSPSIVLDRYPRLTEVPQKPQPSPKDRHPTGAAFESFEVVEQTCAYVNARGLEEEPASDPAHVHGQYVPRGDDMRSSRRVTRHPEQARHIS